MWRLILGVKTGRGFYPYGEKKMIGFDLTPEQKVLQEKQGNSQSERLCPWLRNMTGRDLPLDVTRKAYDEGLLTLVIPRNTEERGSGSSIHAFCMRNGGCLHGYLLGIFVSTLALSIVNLGPRNRRNGS